MTDQYAVFGNPIAHSKSPDIHAAFAKQTGQDLEYKKQLVEVDDFQLAAETFFNAGGKGLNITVPFKTDAYQFAQQLTRRARQAGAVNTLALQEDGTILGDNTDGIGMVSDIVTNLNWPLKNKTVLLIGAGGAMRGVIGPIIEQKPRAIVIVNRTESKAASLAMAFDSYAKEFGTTIIASSFSGLKQQSFDVIVNGTSASLAGDLPPIPTTVVTADSKCYDMMYGAKPTVFMQWAMDLGGECADGLGMLVGQAAEAFSLWRDVQPERESVIKNLRAQLSD